jgi:hypothetical protein
MVETFIKFLPNDIVMKIIFPKIIYHVALINGRYHIWGEKQINSMKYSLWECSTNHGKKL